MVRGRRLRVLIPPHFVWGVIALWCAEMLYGAFKSYMEPLLPSVTHWFFEKFEVPYSEGTDGFLSSRSRLWCPFLKPRCVLPDLGCTSVHDPHPPAGGDLSYVHISPAKGLLRKPLKSVSKLFILL